MDWLEFVIYNCCKKGKVREGKERKDILFFVFFCFIFFICVFFFFLEFYCGFEFFVGFWDVV